MSKEFNGWKNRETWAFMLHMNNDQGLQSILVDTVRGAYELSEDGREVPRVAEALQALAESLFTDSGYRDEFGDEWPKGLRACAEDIGSLWRVDWRECAESLLEDLVEVDA